MWIAAESIENRLVAHLEIETVLEAGTSEQLQGDGVNRQRFTVHEGQIQEGAAIGRQIAVMALRDSLLRQCEGERILSKSVRCAAVDIAGKLIEDDDLGQPTLLGGAPAEQLASRRGGKQRAETSADGGVERIGHCIPAGGTDFGELEIENGLGGWQHQLTFPCGSNRASCHSALSSTLARACAEAVTSAKRV